MKWTTFVAIYYYACAILRLRTVAEEALLGDEKKNEKKEKKEKKVLVDLKINPTFYPGVLLNFDSIL